MNFGVKITILYLSFVALILTLVFLSYGQKVELVSKDYYAQELKYQDKIDAINNTNALASSIDHKVEASSIILNINPELNSSGLSGSINFFRPSDSSKDVKIKMNFVNDQQVISKSALEHGTYKMQLSWTNNGKNYYKEEVIYIE
jgi:nitrogen fixation protein FixH